MNNSTLKKKEPLPVTCRPARPDDTPQVLALAALIWDGEDYIPDVWESWLADLQGLLAVAEWQGQVVGLCKLTRHSSQSWWLEGLRTHPDFTRRGVASHIFRYMLTAWQRIGAGGLRFATHSENVPIHLISQRLGFQKLGELVIYKTSALSQDCPEPLSDDPSEILQVFQPVLPAEAPLVFTFLQNSPILQLNLGLVDLGWTWSTPSLRIIQDAIQQNLAWWWRRSLSDPVRQLSLEQLAGGLILICLDEEVKEGPPQWVIQALASPVDQLARILADIRCLAIAQSASAVSWNISNLTELTNAVLSAGYQRAWHLSLFIYGMEHNAIPLAGPASTSIV